VPKNNLFKIGVATAAAAAGAVLAFSTVFAHSTPTTTGRSMVGTIVNAATGATLVSFEDQAPTAVTDEQTSDAEEAAELAAEIAAQQAEAAAELAAQQAELAAEAAEAAETDEAETEVEAADTEQADTQDVEQTAPTSGDHESGD
jgi:hypothetical protein